MPSRMPFDAGNATSKPVTAIYPGSFDPVTNGHLDLITRASNIFDRLVVAVAHNLEKDPLFTEKERVEMLETATFKWVNVEIDVFDGLLMDYARAKSQCDRARHPRRLRLRIRIADGHDEPQDRTGHRNRLHASGGAIQLSEL